MKRDGTLGSATWFCALAVLLALPDRPAAAQGAEPASCQDAAAAAEQKWAIPSKLLSAIGIRESGRQGGAGRAVSWPWALNAEGKGFFAANKQDAVAQVHALQAGGTQSIDVGCFQINLAAHPLAFASLETAFDPMTNGDYAGQFLASLHQRTGSWLTAVAAYHSSTPPLGEAYRQQVFAEWLGPADRGPWLPDATVPPPSGTIRLASFRSVIAVWGPAGRMDIAPVSARPGPRLFARLPRVITPTMHP
jgi:hypothetical protein